MAIRPHAPFQSGAASGAGGGRRDGVDGGDAATPGRTVRAWPFGGIARLLAAAGAAGLLAAVSPGLLPAQQEGVFLDAGFSHSRPPPGSSVDPSTYGMSGLRVLWHPGRRSRVTGSLHGGLSFDDAAGDWAALSGSVDLWTPAGDVLVLGLGARGQAFAVGAPFEYAAAQGELRPRTSLDLGGVWLTLQGRAGVGRSEVQIRDVPGLPATVSPTDEVEADLWYWGGGPELTIPAGPLDVGLGAALYESEGGDYGLGSASLSGDLGPVEVLAELGVWDTPDGDEVTGGVTVSVPLASGWTLSASGRRVEPDPLLRTPPSPQGSLTASLRLVRLADEPAPALYRVRKDDDAGTATVTFRLRRPGATKVTVLGDFTGWEPVAMERRDGVWTAEVEAEPGVHHFGFRVDGEWFVPEDAPGRTPDEWGRTNATLVVPR